MIASSALSRAPWYVVQTQANRESRAASELAKQGFEVFLPRYMRQVRHARRVTKVAAPLFPGYLFTRFGAGARWRAVNGTVGVVRLVTAGERPAPLADNIVDELMARRDGQGYVPLPPRAALVSGETVRVAKGAFAEVFGLFEEMRDADRVAVLIELLGCKVRVLMEGALVEKVA